MMDKETLKKLSQPEEIYGGAERYAEGLSIEKSGDNIYNITPLSEMSARRSSLLARGLRILEIMGELTPEDIRSIIPVTLDRNTSGLIVVADRGSERLR